MSRDPYHRDPLTGHYPAPTLGTTHGRPPSKRPCKPPITQFILPTLPYTPTHPHSHNESEDVPYKKDGGGGSGGGSGGASAGTREPSRARRKDRAAVADREDRIAHGWAPRSRYLHITGPTPVLGPSDFPGARVYLARIDLAISQGRWTDNERTRLHRLHRVWSNRAAGQDPRFNLHGNRPGGLTSTQLSAIASSRVNQAIGTVLFKLAKPSAK